MATVCLAIKIITVLKVTKMAVVIITQGTAKRAIRVLLLGLIKKQ